MATRKRPADATRTGEKYVSQATVARHLGVRQSAVANWMVRRDTFPVADAVVDGAPVWLESRLGEWKAWHTALSRWDD